MIVLQPADIGRNRRGPRLDAAVIGVDVRLGRRSLAFGVIQMQAHVVMQTALVALQRQRIVAALSNDLVGNQR